MRKKVFGRKLSRDRGSREALFRSLVRAMLERGKIVTTKAKAKAVQPMLEKLVSMSKTKDVSVIRRTYAFLANDKKSVKTLFNEIADAFKTKNGGYTRLINLPRRLGDNAELMRMEWTEKIEISDKGKVKSDKSGEKKDKLLNSGGKVVKKSLRSRVEGLVRKKKD
jgi:large subunit ribosomal protein L17